MKKILLIVALCVAFCFVSTSAIAADWCGRLDMLGLCIGASDSADVPPPCCVNFTFTPDGGGGPWALWGTAMGTEINLALLKALNAPEQVDALVNATQAVGPFGITWTFVIETIGFGTCDACCPVC